LPSTQAPLIPPSAYIQAYESQLIYNRPDLASRVASRDLGGPSSTRGRLIQWGGDDGLDENIWADR
jgi:hypothetical protein